MQDAFSLASHQKAVAAQAAGRFDEELVPVNVTNATPGPRPANLYRSDSVFSADEGPRADTTAEALAALKPVFHAQGTVTAGNSSQTSDGAAAAVLMDAARAKELGIQPLARLVAYAVAGCLPEEMGMGPLYAVPKALKKAGLKLDDIGLIEFNEAFAAQALAVMRELGFDPEKVNVNGGAIALGHPLGCTGAKLTATLLRGNETPQRALRDGDHVRGRRPGSCGHLRAAELRTGFAEKEKAGIAPGQCFFNLLPFGLSATQKLSLSRRQCLQPRVEAALVAGNGVRVKNALLDALVEGGNGLAELRLRGLHIALGQRFAQGARLARTRLRLARFTAVRVSVWRARFSDDTWFAILLP